MEKTLGEVKAGQIGPTSVSLEEYSTVLGAIFLLCTYQRSKIFALEAQMLSIFLQCDSNTVDLQFISCVLHIYSSSVPYQDSIFIESSTSKIYNMRGGRVTTKVRTSTVRIVRAGHI